MKFIKEYYSKHSLKETYRAFLERYPDIQVTQDAFKSLCCRKHFYTVSDGRFKSGHAPFNAGTKGFIKANKGSFKKGHQPANIVTVGTERVLSDGYTWVKINDIPKVKKSVNWIQKHKKVWLDTHPGQTLQNNELIVFLDGNRRNFDPANLEKITKQENAILNKNRLRGPEGQITRSAIMMVRLKQTRMRLTEEKRK
ncbi:MAG: HNH endonuclease [Erysipelotrichaceae bacterium]|nr:HNH endonuclease [Erysipelotrichaceae bacterium]